MRVGDRNIFYKILQYAMNSTPIDIKWIRLIKEEFKCPFQVECIPHIPKSSFMLSHMQADIWKNTWQSMIFGVHTLLIETPTRHGQTTALLYLAWILCENISPESHVVFVSENLRLSHLACERFQEVQKLFQYDNLHFLPRTARIPKCDILIEDAYDIVDNDMKFSVPFYVQAYHAFRDPNGHFGNDKTMFVTDESIRATFEKIITYP